MLTKKPITNSVLSVIPVYSLTLQHKQGPRPCGVALKPSGVAFLVSEVTFESNVDWGCLLGYWGLFRVKWGSLVG